MSALHQLLILMKHWCVNQVCYQVMQVTAHKCHCHSHAHSQNHPYLTNSFQALVPGVHECSGALHIKQGCPPCLFPFFLKTMTYNKGMSSTWLMWHARIKLIPMSHHPSHLLKSQKGNTEMLLCYPIAKPPPDKTREGRNRRSVISWSP